MKLNLRCGGDRRKDWHNVDKMPACEPDEVVDLEQFPWPWDDNSASEVLIRHALEHLGADTETYLGIIRELWRVCRDGATVTVIVPHPRHDSFLNDPTHVRAITPQGLEMFSQKKNREWIANRNANTPLGLYLGVDFDLVSVDFAPEEPWREQLAKKQLSMAQFAEAIRRFNNVVRESVIVLRAVKSGQGAAGAPGA